MMRVFLAGLLFAISAGPTLAEQARDNEAMVMRIIFEDCLGFVERDEAPFRGLDLIAISERGKEAFNAAAQASATMRHLFSTRYAAAWGEDEHARYCMIQTVQPPEGPMRLAVNPDGFLQRMTARASALGMTEHNLVEPLSPLATNDWREPGTGDLTELRVVILPTDANEARTLMDIGIILVAAGSDRVGK